MAVHGPISNQGRGKPVRRRNKSAAPADLTLVSFNPGVSMPDSPDVLGETGRAAWSAVYASAPWLSSEADASLVQQFAELCDERAELRALIAEHGRTTRGSMGQLVDSPFVTQLRSVEGGILKLCQVLGLGPVNAARLGVSATGSRRGTVSDEQRARALRALRGVA